MPRRGRLVGSVAAPLILAGALSLGPTGSGWARDAPRAPADQAFGGELRAEFPSDGAWNAARDEVIARLTRFSALRTQPIRDGARLADRLDEIRFLRGRAGAMARFAAVSQGLDDSDAVAKERFDAATALETRVESAVAWIDAAVLAVPPRRLGQWIARESRLRRHGWRLGRIRAEAGHQIPFGAEAAAASLERAITTASEVRDALMQSDLGWPRIRDGKGAEIIVDEDRWSELTRDRDGALRDAANAAWFSHLEKLQAPLGLLLARRFGAAADLAHIRGYANPIDAFFDRSDGLPAGAVDRLMASARANRATASRWSRLIARMHGVPRAEYGDFYARGPAFPRTFTFEDARANVIAAAAPLGADYQASLRARLDARWFDWIPRPHKSGLGSYWQVGRPEGRPLTLLTFDGAFGSTKTLAQAAFGAMNYADIPAEKAPERREEDYPVYGNAIWFLGQILYDDSMIAKARTKAERIAILYDDVWRLWSTFFQYATATELEQRILRGVDEGRPPSGARISAIYLGLLREYYPPAGDGPAVADSWGAQALDFPNMYYGEVLPEWALAMSGAAALAARIEAGDRATIEAVTHPLRRRASYTSHDLLMDAGVDLTTDAPYEALIARMNAKMRDLEREISKEE